MKIEIIFIWFLYVIFVFLALPKANPQAKTMDQNVSFWWPRINNAFSLYRYISLLILHFVCHFHANFSFHLQEFCYLRINSPLKSPLRIYGF